jgi:hypothetical protein
MFTKEMLLEKLLILILQLTLKNSMVESKNIMLETHLGQRKLILLIKNDLKLVLIVKNS